MTQPTSTINDQDIINYYDTCEIDYKLVWHLDSHFAMHYGYWDKDTRSLRDALHNMNKVVAHESGIQDGLRILDAGCGVGGTAINLGMHFACNFEGITLSKQQVDRANANAANRSLKGNVRFSVQDYTGTDFEDGSFDIIYAIESVCHAGEKKDFLDEAYRLLKKGGKLVVADFFLTRSNYSDKESRLLQQWGHSWAVDAFEPIVDFERKTGEAGFLKIKNQDLTKNIYKSARRLYQCFFPGFVVHHIMALMKKRNKTQAKNLWSTYYQYHALNKKLWSYHLVSAIK